MVTLYFEFLIRQSVFVVLDFAEEGGGGHYILALILVLRLVSPESA